MACQAHNIPSHCRAQQVTAHHHDIALHHVTWHNTSNHIASNDVTSTSNYTTLHVMTWHATSHLTSSTDHVTSQPTTLLHLTPPATSWHQNRPHHRHGTAEGSLTAKKWFGHRAGRSPCAHSVGKVFLCYYIVPFILKLPPPARQGTTCMEISFLVTRIQCS